MTGSFVYEALPTRVVFGYGALARLVDELGRLGASRAVVLSTPEQRHVRCVVDHLGSLAAGVFAGATMHTPVDVTEHAVDVVSDAGADCLVAVGGGSTIGLGKAIALRSGLMQVAVPTTYAGSELTPIVGETIDGAKTTRRTVDVLPESVVYDVELTLTLPPRVVANSGMNAVAHAVEALYARGANPVVSLVAAEGIARMASALPRIIDDPADAAARSDALYAASLCGICLGSVDMALHHKLCHVLGGTFGLPHAETHAAVLPHAVAYTASAAPEAMRTIAGSLGADDAAEALADLGERIGAERALRDIGMSSEAIEPATDLAVADPYWNPRPLDRDAVLEVIARAWAGDRPTT